jgi:hypothetical protein
MRIPVTGPDQRDTAGLARYICWATAGLSTIFSRYEACQRLLIVKLSHAWQYFIKNSHSLQACPLLECPRGAGYAAGQHHMNLGHKGGEA